LDRLVRAYDYPAALTFQLRAVGLPDPVAEHRFHPERRWRVDLAWPDLKVAVEIDGGTWIQGRHTSGSGFANDARKLNEAAILGWRVLRVTPSMVRDGEALGYVERILR
jgi:very-short-patch-repair endonuclease